ncbi:MAG TPA: AMP-binding protein [Acidimicrobiales bacterium]|nr:AMP-binding protein [Acidimicrobiales bacterium]
MELLHALTLGDVLREHRRSYPQRTAVVCGDVRLTWPELDDRVNQLANALRAVGVGPGDRVLWLGQNCHRVLEAMLACAKLGAAFSPANWRQTGAEFAFVVDDARPAVVIWQQEEVGDAIAEARAKATHQAHWVQHDHHEYEDLVASGDPADPAIDVDPASPALQIYTAAFTGTPNGALVSHTAVVVQDLIMANLQRIDSSYVYLNAGPLFHVATLMTTLATFHMAGTNVFTRRVDAEELCRLIDAEGCTGAFVIGPTIAQILEVNADGRFNLKTLRTFAGAPAWNEMITVDESPWTRKPAGYGQTEVMGMLTFNAVGGDATGAHGRPSPAVQVRIVDPDGNDVPPGETGEIVGRGPAMMNGYFDRDDLNAARQAGGWHHTNDLGRREPDGSITFIGPKTRIIKSAAENIYPTEVESALAKYPAVKEAAVIGIPDPTWTQSVKAIVVLKDGEAATAEDIIEHCRASIASYKKPRTVEFVDALPRQGWAVDYDALDAQFGGGGYPGVR